MTSLDQGLSSSEARSGKSLGTRLAMSRDRKPEWLAIYLLYYNGEQRGNSYETNASALELATALVDELKPC